MIQSIKGIDRMKRLPSQNGHKRQLFRRHHLLRQNLIDETTSGTENEDVDKKQQINPNNQTEQPKSLYPPVPQQNNTTPNCRYRPQTYNNSQYTSQGITYSVLAPSLIRYYGKQYLLYGEYTNLPYCDQLQKGANIPLVLILCILLVILVIAFVVWLINTIRKRIQTTKQYNQTPQNFIQKPSLTLNQSKNLKLNQLTRFSNYNEKDLIIENKTQFGGNIYEVKFINTNSKPFSCAYWSKVLKTDCYFQLEIQQVNSQIQFGFVNRKYFDMLDSGMETKLPRVGVILNTQGNLQLLGQIKYQYRWKLQYGDVVGIGLTLLDNTRRIWVTKNGILLNPPTSDQVEKWLTKESLSQQHRDAYYSLNQQNKTNNLNRKQDNQLIKRKLILPANQDFEYYAVVSSLEMKAPQVKKDTRRLMSKNAPQNKEQQLFSTVRVNVGGKTFRIRDHNLRSGLLADSIEKNQFCNWLPCF